MPKAKWKNFTDEELKQIVAESTSFVQVQKKLGYTARYPKWATAYKFPAEAVLTKRIAMGYLNAGVMAIGCGILMSASVEFARKGKDFGYWVPLCMAVPLFILCGFPHCIADAFYYMSCSNAFLAEHWLETLGTYGSIVLGNFIGCNVYHVKDVIKEKEKTFTSLND